MIVRIALAQAPSEIGNVKKNWETAKNYIERAAKAKAARDAEQASRDKAFVEEMRKKKAEERAAKEKAAKARLANQ